MFDLPWQTLSLNPLAAFGILLLLGILGGKISTRSIRLPRVTGYIVAGLIIGPAGLKLISHEIVEQADFFIQLGLGLALFEQGRRLDMNWLIREKALLVSTCLISLIVLASLTFILWLADIPPVLSIALASLLVATSPALVLDVIEELRAEGQLTERLTVHTGISNLIALLVFSFSLTYAHISSAYTLTAHTLLPLILTLGAIVTGIAAGIIATRLNIWLGGRNAQAQGVLLCAIIALIAGLSSMLSMLPMLALLIFGLTVRSLRRHSVFSAPGLVQYGTLFYVALFVAIGTQLHFGPVSTALPIILGLIAIRLAVTLVGWCLAARANGLSLTRGAWLAVALTPMPTWPSTLFILMAQASVFEIVEPIQVVAGAVYLTQLFGPILTQQALRRSGDCPIKQIGTR